MDAGSERPAFNFQSQVNEVMDERPVGEFVATDALLGGACINKPFDFGVKADEHFLIDGHGFTLRPIDLTFGHEPLNLDLRRSLLAPSKVGPTIIYLC